MKTLVLFTLVATAILALANAQLDYGGRGGQYRYNPGNGQGDVFANSRSYGLGAYGNSGGYGYQGHGGHSGRGGLGGFHFGHH